ncbi:MAG: aspartate kinase [Oligoflexia bacterium]|nr:aspartate kinase [Oligoflexia bacterium]
MLIVKKYGGTSVATPEKILDIAKHLKKLSEEGHKLIIIISAMGDTTDDLVDLSRRITHTPIQREMDMLLSAGERISMALMSMALNSLGCSAISFTGSQSGVLTDGSHNSARIIDIRPFRVEEELKKGRIVIIAGFQGVNPQTKEITTLGRGGSDTTAVAMAAQFKADRCDILTDVRGIYTIDPRISGVVPKHLEKLDYAMTMEMAYWGARVLHYRSVELAERAQVPVLVHLSSEEGSGSLIETMEATHIQAVNYNAQLAVLKFGKGFDLKISLEAIEAGLTHGKLSVPQIIYERGTENGREIFITAPPEHFDSILASVSEWCKHHKKTPPTLETHLATVTLSGRGLVNSKALFEASSTLSKNAIETEALITTPLSITYVVASSQVQNAAQLLHKQFVG